MIGVTMLTVVMPRLSRNAAADDIPAVLDDLGLATRLTMVTLIPTVAFMTVGGSAIGSALFAYGKFGSVDAGYLGSAIALSAFTLIPYAMVLLQLRVFYAASSRGLRFAIIIVITTVKISASVAVQQLAVHHVIGNPEMVAGYLGLANGLGFVGRGRRRISACCARRWTRRAGSCSARTSAHRAGDHRRVVGGGPRRLRRGPIAAGCTL